ncbi:efflux RND transporter periplasmic adaptor subunit [Lewinella sp. IMCC34183]|uniref:efflux RND transporter periplasmic adaptor subunit n=1 Tax=Lewinella sp. IMCC34183 TaxID=2248762 RepID=UPI000E23ABD9|nr:efflux RND transporter periplasmic adaptor subunit [Lewinella sp. IMCC34183]
MKIYPLLLFPLLLACGGGGSDAGQEGSAKEQERAVGVRVAEVEARDLVFYESFPGTVSPLERVEVRPQVSGYITKKHFEDGARVRQGQQLYTIDVRRYVADVNQAEAGIEAARADVALAEKNVARYRRLAEAEAIAIQTLDQAEAELESRRQALNQAEASLNSAQTQLDYAAIRAPLTGITDLGSAKVGTQVSPGSPVLTAISQEEPVGVDFALPQDDIPRLAGFEQMSREELDSTFRLRLPDGTIYPFFGVVYASDQAVDARTGALTVRLRFPNQTNVLRNGMNVTVELLNRQSGRQLVIPSKALAEQMGEFYVYTVRDSMAFRQNVTTGEQVRDLQIVLDGVEEGMQVVVEGLKAVKDSSRVKITPLQN